MTSRSWWHKQKSPNTTDDIAVRDSDEWVLLISTGSPALAGMYLDLLRQAGIPVRATEWGSGSAALGGVPVGMTLRVPSARYDEAAAVLAPATNDEDSAHE